MQVIRSLGLRGLYKGAGVCLMRDIPYAVIFFPLYATLKEKAADSNGKNSMTSILAAGAAAGATAAAFCTPG
jgi:solute carrier family 25 aspartate/glutamate transporter 12/13